MKLTGPDSLNSWFITVCCSLISMLLYGVVRLSGVLFVASISKFQINREKASFPYILCDCIQASSGPITGYLGLKFGIRSVTTFGSFLAAVGIGTCFFAKNIETVTVLWGIVYGFGFGLCSLALPVVITQNFVTKRATAIGVMFAGSYVGFSFLPSVVDFLLEEYGLSGSFLWLSAFVLHCVPLSMLLRKPDVESKNPESNIRKSTLRADVIRTNSRITIIGNSKEYLVPVEMKNYCAIKELSSSTNRKKSYSVFKIFLEPVFILVLISAGVYGGSFIAFVTVIVDLTRDLGVPLVNGKYVIMVFSMASNLGLLSFGWVTDKGHMTKSNFAGFMFLLRSITLTAIPFSNGFVMLGSLVAIQGFFESSLACLFPLIVAEYFSDEVNEMAISSVLFLCGPIFLVTPSIIGFFRDGFGSYHYLFYSMSALSLVCSFLMFVVTLLLSRCNTDFKILRKRIPKYIYY